MSIKPISVGHIHKLTAFTDPELLDNAYVTGLKKDLGFHGNELVHCQTIYTVGSVIGQLPFTYLFTKVPMSYLIPGGTYTS